jgi:uncharacterized protein YifE (UPF0438 family)
MDEASIGVILENYLAAHEELDRTQKEARTQQDALYAALGVGEFVVGAFYIRIANKYDVRVTTCKLLEWDDVRPVQVTT